MKLENKKWPLEKFLNVRKDVLATWKTGNSPNLDLAVSLEYLKQVPPHKNFSKKLIEAKEKRLTLVQPRAGVALVDEHLELLLHLQNAGADFLPTTIDSYTRQNRYEEAELGIEFSKKEARSFLNGFPAVNHGVLECQRVLESVDLPLQARHGTPDARLLAEIIHAAGWMSNEGGAISYNIPYAKNISLRDSIFYWQYCDRLVGYYEDQGISINREPFGPLTGTLVPPSIGIAIGIIEALLAAEQGVKNITVGYGQCGNIIQDVAALRMLEELTEEYMKRFGYDDVIITTVFHQWMGGFPADEDQALGLISIASAVAALAGTTKLITKTPLESIGIPTKEANASGIKASKFVVSLLQEQFYPNSKALLAEEKQIALEVNSLMDFVLKVGNNDLVLGVIKSFEQGILDIPFAPSKYNANKVLPARDLDGCIRILEFGNLGFSEEIKKFHQKKLALRAKKEKREVSFQMCVDDIYAVSSGRLIGNNNLNIKKEGIIK
jgi:methylaspartate mutase epsilon subunit